jgi:hypothetical protein
VGIVTAKRARVRRFEIGELNSPWAALRIPAARLRIAQFRFA